ncbi:hypothetical protein HAX54_018775 [Datura stramonium]|uniref:Mannan endo-1,4-beta-mannosidase n=1 Tax=Datura stramonium TaxID=4076 RepID=A0ABS8UQ89_DATST|nr:hypothetical protein [Datura stramonium]
MATYSSYARKLLVVFIISCCCIFNFSYGRTIPNFRVRAVNLGGWLLTEGWIKPSLFDDIPNKDFLDGTGLQFKSVTVGKYLCAELGGGTIIVANRTSASGWETFKVKTEELVTADYNGGNGGWGDDDPSVFIMQTSGRLEGEFQVTNGYGPIMAPQVMREHWSTFIVEEDFKFIASNGLNAVRIPIGWWIASDPTPPKPYVGGSLQTLDNAFLWARKYGLKVIIDLHAAPGSQNPWEHSANRDGTIEWGKTDDTIQQTIAVIDFLTARYAKNPSLYAVELINEPLAPEVTFDMVQKYYEGGYNAVRKHSSTAYVVMSNRLGPVDPTELLSFASGLKGSVIDVHYYNLFSDMFNNMSVQQNIDFVNTNRSAQLNTITQSNGPLTFVGEWVAEWQVRDATKEDYQKFGKAQLEVFGRATFGWAYWTLKNVNSHWSLEWMIKNGYINL